ncbi:MAG TPA: arginine--tRNA ligase [Syntrophorhabdaceae bacterium]|nr:arginine--tRNA ligase [Syntrophorhabdaceae bacterium]
MLRKKIAQIIVDACDDCRKHGLALGQDSIDPFVEIPRDLTFGDYSTNIAFVLAPVLKQKPEQIARLLIDHIKPGLICEKVEIAGKGFINFYVKDPVWLALLKDIYEKGIAALYPNVGHGNKVLIEFVSANPTGPLHIGHGRGAVVGDVLANILRTAGYDVAKEYYINDAGKQIKTLGESTYLRWRELEGESVSYPKECYQGDYVKDLARELIETKAQIPAEKDRAVEFMSKFSSAEILTGIKNDLKDFGVLFDNYYEESTLFDKGIVDDTLSYLKDKGYAYEKDGALWFKTSLFEKDEDRVLIKSDGEKTYFTSDIAYHRDKLNRSFDMLVDIWGSDHHGYIPRLKASIEALGKDKEALKVLLIQFVTLLKDGKPVGMSTRSGEFTTLAEVVKDVGKDAARFFFLTRKCDAHLEFDLDLAKKTTNENPVYYVQYAHARIESIFRNAEDQGIGKDALSNADISRLTLSDEINLVKGILHFHNVIDGSARSLEPHRVTFFLMDLVGKFHSYYNKTRVLGNAVEITVARLWLLYMLKEVIREGLTILGVSAPEKM